MQTRPPPWPVPLLRVEVQKRDAKMPRDQLKRARRGRADNPRETRVPGRVAQNSESPVPDRVSRHPLRDSELAPMPNQGVGGCGVSLKDLVTLSVYLYMFVRCLAVGALCNHFGKNWCARGRAPGRRSRPCVCSRRASGLRA
eukprot:4205206-Pyramimonas_sp.AAC.1